MESFEKRRRRELGEPNGAVRMPMPEKKPIVMSRGSSGAFTLAPVYASMRRQCSSYVKIR
jgi:hypothetical protein